MNLTVSNYNVMTDIENELSKARFKFPKCADTLPALMEEVGELAQAMIQQKHEPNKNICHENIYKEAVQVACMAIRIATEGDTNFPYHPESGYRGKNWRLYKQKCQCCDRGDEYNGFSSGPTSFTCSAHCACHD